MGKWKEVTAELTELMQLTTRPIGVKRLENKEDMAKIPDVEKPHAGFTWCQIPHHVRKLGKTVGITKADFEVKTSLKYRCLRVQGLAPADHEQFDTEAKSFENVWFNTYETGMEQMAAYPKVAPIEAMVMSPLDEEKFEPDFLMIYGQPASMMVILNALQYYNYERFNFYFTGEGACADSLPQAVATGKPALSVPCMGERMLGAVGNDEMLLALPAELVDDALKGLKTMKEHGLALPITPMDPANSAADILAGAYPLN